MLLYLIHVDDDKPVFKVKKIIERGKKQNKSGRSRGKGLEVINQSREQKMSIHMKEKQRRDTTNRISESEIN